MIEIRVGTTESRFEGYLNRLLQQNLEKNKHRGSYESVTTENDRLFQQDLSSGLLHESSEDDA